MSFPHSNAFFKHFLVMFHGMIRKQMGRTVKYMLVPERSWRSSLRILPKLGMTHQVTRSEVWESPFSLEKSSNFLLSPDSLPSSPFLLSQPNENPPNPVKTFQCSSKDVLSPA